MDGTCIDCAYKYDDEAPAYDVCSCGTPLATCSCGNTYCPVDIGYCTNCEEIGNDAGDWDEGWYADSSTCECGASLSTCSNCGSSYCPVDIGDCFCQYD
jgi:hypothetical protein